MDTKRRVGGATASLGWIGAFGRELVVSRPPSETLKWIGEIVSPTSLYLGLTILGIGAFFYFSWPVWEWAWNIPAHRRERRRLAEEKEADERERRIKVKAAREEAERRATKEKEEKERKATRELNKRAVDAMERLQRLIREQLSHDHIYNPGQYAENAAEIEILKQDFVAAGLGFPEGAEDPGQDRGWLNHISKLLPRVRRYGISKVVDEFNCGENGHA